MTDQTSKTTHPVLIFWITAGWVGFCLLPWYMVDGGLWSFEWLLDGYPFDEGYAPAAFLIGQGEKLWLAPLVIALALPLLVLKRTKSDPVYARILILSGALGFGWLISGNPPGRRLLLARGRFLRLWLAGDNLDLRLCRLWLSAGVLGKELFVGVKIFEVVS